MPAASSRRRTHRRQASSDIEDGQPSQVSARDDVDEDEEEQPRPPARTASSKKGKGRAVAQAPAADEDETERIDVTNFGDQPLKKEDILKIGGLARDWQQVVESVAKFGAVFGNVGVSLADASNEETTRKVFIPY